MCSHTKGFEVEHQSEGTDGSLISKLEMGMINALGQLCPTRAPRNRLASVYIDVYERVWSGAVFVVVHVSSGINARRHVAASPSMQMTSACSFSAPFVCIDKKDSVALVMCLCCCAMFFVCVCTPQASAQQAAWMNGRQSWPRGEVSTTNSLKHTTDIKDDERRKKQEKRSGGARRPESERKHW